MKWRSVVAGRVVRVPHFTCMVPRAGPSRIPSARLQISKSKSCAGPGRLCVVAEIHCTRIRWPINRLKKYRYTPRTPFFPRFSSLNSSCSLSATNSLPIPTRNNDQPKSHRPLRPRGPFRPPLHRRRAAAAPSEQQESAPRAGGESSRYRADVTVCLGWELC